VVEAAAVIIPLNHENMHGRRWPYVTIGIIALNAVVFLATHWTIDREVHEMGELREHILLLAAAHPDTPMNAAEQKLVESFRRSQAKTWELLSSDHRTPFDAWDVQMRAWAGPRCEEEMTLLGVQLDQMQAESTLGRYAFYPSRRAPITYLTANFLHGGWMHLIFNMWFLWLAGAVLEDTWGRPLYAAFYLISGVAALWGYALVYPNGIIPVLGASGAIASLMGAFLVRFPKTKIQLGFFYWILRPRLYRFKAPAYAVLPLWLGMQLLSGTLAGESGGVAYWAHIGGFGFGLVMALILRYSGIEQRADQAIQEKVGWSADPRIVKATDLLEKEQFDAAISEMKALIAEKPASGDGYEMLSSIYLRKGDTQSYLQAMETVCQLHLKVHNVDAAWQDYEDYAHAGGAKMPAASWLELCRHAEDIQQWERAASEYEKLAEAWPQDRSSVIALISAARIQLKQLSRPQEALRLYIAAQNSPIPHQDWNNTIRKGIDAAMGKPNPAPSEPAAPPMAGSLRS
jgi:membrane associated rhomboid family serine protease